MISFVHKGDFSKTSRFLEKAGKGIDTRLLDRYGRQGVKALSAATPKDTGQTAASWQYVIIQQNGSVSITFENTNIQNEVPIAIILQYGHATKNGGWVQGRDYINPAIRPLFDQLANEAWEEVTHS